MQFELNLATAQQKLHHVGKLDAKGAQGGPAFVATQPFYVTINDVLGADTSGAAIRSGRNDALQRLGRLQEARNGPRSLEAPSSSARSRFAITGVGGLNDALGVPTIQGTCTTCHDTPNIGNHSVALPIDIGLTDASRRTPDMPLYTLQNVQTGEIRKTTDPGRALLTGHWADIGKFKGPVLRGLAARPPYFHNGLAADLGKVVDFYDTRFSMDSR